MGTGNVAMIQNDVVRLRMTAEELAKFNPNPNVGISSYDYEPDMGEVNAIFTTSRLPGVAGNAEKDDTINEQLADLNRKVCQDATKVKNIPNKMQTFYTFLDNPNLDGENDHIRSKAERTKYQVKVPAIQLKEINDQFEREGKRCMNDIKGEINHKDGSREFLFDYGEVL